MTDRTDRKKLHEEMFILFICYANSMSFNERKYSLPISQSEMIALQYIVEREYLLDFSNRNIHEERHEYKDLVEAIGNVAKVKNSEIALIAKKYAELEAENEKLKKEVRTEGKAKSVAQELIKWHQSNYTKLETENVRFRKALESISKNTCCEPCQEAKNVAREALKDNK